MLLVAVLCVLLIACVNVANLFLTRLNFRRPELALRSALGAGRWSLIRQILSGGLVLSSLGCLIGLAVGWLGVRLLLRIAPSSLPRTSGISLNGKVVLFSVALTLVAWLLVSLIPALRFSGSRLIDSLKEGGRQTGHAIGQRWLRHAFVVAQVIPHSAPTEKTVDPVAAYYFPYLQPRLIVRVGHQKQAARTAAIQPFL